MLYGRFKYWERVPPPLRRYPATVPMNTQLSPNKGPAFRLSDDLFYFAKEINTARAFQFLMSPNSGWVNEGRVDEKNPLVQSVGFGGNIFEILEIRGKFALVNSMQNGGQVFWSHIPGRWIHQFTCLDTRGRHVLPADGVVAYLPFVTNGPSWVETRKIQIFYGVEPTPDLPAAPPESSYPLVVATKGPVFQMPGKSKVDEFTEDRVVPLMSEGNGWSKIGEQRFVPSSRIRKPPIQ